MPTAAASNLESFPMQRLNDLMRGEWQGESTARVLTVPNLISLGRMLLVPVFVWLLAHEETEVWGFVVLGLVMASDWVDGYIARRTNQVSEVGKLLDPLSDRAVIAAALITFVVLGALPLWAALVVIVRDVLVLLAGLVALRRGSRIDVRWSGKIATWNLMWGFPMIAWGALNLPLSHAATVVGWSLYALGATLYYWAAALYARDLVEALRRPRA